MAPEEPRAPDFASRLALRPAEAAELLGTCTRTLRRWMQHEGLPYFRLGGRVLIPVDHLKEWMAGRVESGRRVDALVDEILEDL